MASDPTERINLAALQQNDPYIECIVETAGQVALYNFNAEANEWEKTDVQGTMFIYTRSAAPCHGFIIMNRLSMHNFTEPISKEMEFQRNDPFLLYKSADSIHGIWFYDKDKCKDVARHLEQLVHKTSRISQRGAKQRTKSVGDPVGVMSHQKPPSTGGIDIIQMLSKAQEEYNQTKSGSSQAPSRPQPKVVKASKAQDPQGQGRLTVAEARGQQHKSQASGGPPGFQRSLSIQEGREQSKSEQVPPLLQELFSQSELASAGPTAGKDITTVESLERLHLADIEGRGAPLHKETTPTGDKKPIDNLFQMLSHSDEQATSRRTPLTPQALTQPPSKGARTSSGDQSGGPLLPSASQLIAHEAPHRIASKGLNSLLRTLATSAPQPTQFTNLPPSALTQRDVGPAGDASSHGYQAGQGAADDVMEPTSPQTIPASFTPSKLLTPSSIQKIPASGLLVPMAVMEPPAHPSPRASPIPTLTKEQFKEAYIFMLQNDSDFVSKLYDAYLHVQSKPKT